MAQMYSTGIQSPIPGVGMIAFKFRVDGTSAPDDLAIPGACAVITTGDSAVTYTVTLAAGCRPKKILYANCALNADALGELVDHRILTADVDSYDSSTGVLTLMGWKVTAPGTDGVFEAEPLVDNTVVSVFIVGQFADDLARP